MSYLQKDYASTAIPSDVWPVFLTKGYFTLIDKMDWPLVRDYRWCADVGQTGIVYAYTKPAGRTIRMHRLIMGVTDPKIEVDHVDGIGLNNRRYNLRLASHQQNMCNRRKRHLYKGIIRQPNDRWTAQISDNGLNHYLGCFSTPEEAARAYDNKARDLFGEFARTNFGSQAF